MKISIIIPVYNVEEYIVRCLDSVASQTYDGQIECLLVDDCGPDNSAQICKDYIEKYSGPITFKFVQREKNGGLSAARNTGIQVASGDYVYFLDSDDEIPENAISLLASEVDKYSGIDVVMGFMYDEKQSNYYKLDCFRDHQYTEDRKWLQFYTFNYEKVIPANGCNKLVRRKFLEENNLYFKPGIIHEDEHWMFFLVKNVNSWAFVFEPTYIRFWNEGSIMTSRNREKEAKNWIEIMNDFCHNLYAPFKKLQLAKCLYLFFTMGFYEFPSAQSKILCRQFIKICLKEHLFKYAFFLMVWSVLKPIGHGIRFQNKLKHYSYCLFTQETQKNKALFAR